MSRLNSIDPTPYIVASMIFLFLTSIQTDAKCSVSEQTRGMKPVITCQTEQPPQ